MTGTVQALFTIQPALQETPTVYTDTIQRVPRTRDPCHEGIQRPTAVLRIQHVLRAPDATGERSANLSPQRKHSLRRICNVFDIFINSCVHRAQWSTTQLYTRENARRRRIPANLSEAQLTRGKTERQSHLSETFAYPIAINAVLHYKHTRWQT